VSAIALAYQDAPGSIEQGSLVVEAVRIPHSGWPAWQLQVENIAFRVTLDATTTVVHLGDADASNAHFARDDAYWHWRRTHVAFPPYWFLSTSEGRAEPRHPARRSCAATTCSPSPARCRNSVERRQVSRVLRNEVGTVARTRLAAFARRLLTSAGSSARLPSSKYDSAFRLTSGAKSG